MANTIKKVRKSVAPYYGAAAVWVIFALFLSLYRVSDFLLAAGLSCGVWVCLRAVCRDEVTEVEVPEPGRGHCGREYIRQYPPVGDCVPENL